MNERTETPLGKDFYFTDGLAGRSSHLILNPLTRRITHLVARKRCFPHGDHVVPMELMAEETVCLKLDQQQIAVLPTIPIRRHWQ